jgi:glutamine synthetase
VNPLEGIEAGDKLRSWEALAEQPSGRRTLDELRAAIQAGEVATVLCVMPDLWGRLVGKRVTTNTFLKTALGDEGLHASLYLFVVDMDMDPRPGYAMTSWDDGFRDCRMVPDLDTLRIVPWLDRTALVICDPYYEDSDELVEVAPRALLRRQLERYTALDMSLKCATELEFFLFTEDYRTAWTQRYRDLHPASYYRSDYHILQSSKDEWLLARVRDAMDRAGIEIEFSKSEWGLGQHEVNLRYTDALEMADRHALYKTGLKEIVGFAGMSATFMAKPFIEDIGSSCHIHTSLWDAAGTLPLLAGEAGAPENDVLRRFIAGQAAHGCDLAVLLAPNVNSYKRFQPSEFAGTNLGWGRDNRTAGLRVVGEGASRRLEHRVPGADANPYLAIAAIAAAGLAGIEGELACPEPLSGDALRDPAIPRVPRSLGEALGRFEASAVAREAFGDVAFPHLCNFFAQERDAFRHETVTDWELVRYFERV